MTRDTPDTWRWGTTVGLFHFGIKDPVFADPATTRAVTAERIASCQPVPLWTEHAEADRIDLTPPSFNGVLGFMRRRRSSRGFQRGASITCDALATMLASGFGVIGFFDTPTPGEGPLPLTMTPSGGARNPFEAYILAARVDGRTSGVYHYSGVGHSLARCREELADFTALLGGQTWFADAAALVDLVADFTRTMWKYAHPNGYRVVLIEAGHIAQNVLSSASSLGLAAAPTCAVSDAPLEELLGLDRTHQAPLYVVGLGVESGVPSIADVRDVRLNPLFAT